MVQGQLGYSRWRPLRQVGAPAVPVLWGQGRETQCYGILAFFSVECLGHGNRDFSLTRVFIASTSIPNTQKMLNKFVLNEGLEELRRWKEVNYKMLETSLVVDNPPASAGDVVGSLVGELIGSLVGELRSHMSQSN